MPNSLFDRLRPLSVCLVLGLAASLAACLAPQPTAAQSGDAAEAMPPRQVPFVTLRNRTGAQDPGQIYGDERSTLTAGACGVRARDFGALDPLAQSAPAFVREEFLYLDQVTDLETDKMLEDLQQSAAGRGPALYVHGYYISFEKGCRRAVLLQENAALAGRFLWFSWPSDGALAYYTHDEADLFWSVPDMADTLLEMERRFGSGAVDVVGHSLGARGVVLALQEVAHRQPDIRLGDVVLLAPDMDFGIFQRILPRIAPIARSLTVYIAAGDRPLAVSAQLHGYARLGETGNDVASLAGVEVIDLSDLPGVGPTGHLYHIYSRDVGRDLDQLLNGGLAAAARQNLVQTGPNTWRMQPSEGGALRP